MGAQSGTTSRTAISSRGEWQWAWLIVFLMNLPVPLLFGSVLTSHGGTSEMWAGIVVTWLAGHVAVARFHFQRGAIVFGGMFLAVSQLVPLLQIGAGMVAMRIAAFTPLRSFAGGGAFVVTLLTAAQLAVVAWLLGRALEWLGSWRGAGAGANQG